MASTTIYPKLAEYFKACEAIDAKDVNSRNPKKIFEYLKKAPKINSRISGHYITRTTALTCFDYNIIDDNFKDIEKVKERCKPVIDFIIDNHAKAALYGSSLYLLEIVNNDLGSNLLIKETVDNEDYDFDSLNIYLYKDGKITNTINRLTDAFHLLDNIPYLSKGGALRTIMPSEIIRWDMVLENANWLKKLKGILQIINKGGSEEDSKNATQAAGTAVNDNYLVTGEEIEFKLNQIAGAGGDSFGSFVSAINNDIAIALLGQANTSELPQNGGSRAALQIMALISKDILYSDMVRIEKLINKYLMMDYKLNSGEGKMPYQFLFDIAEEHDSEREANAISTLRTAGIPLKSEEIYNRIGFTKPEPNDEVL